MEFDKASDLFDLYVDWDRRLGKEIPYIISRIQAAKGQVVADLACGSGMHAVALAQAGFSVTALDPNSYLLEKTKKLAKEKDVKLCVEEARFDSLPGSFISTFDAVICMGNSLSLATPGQELERALHGIAGILKPSGIFLAHTLNYPQLSNRPSDPWGPVRILSDGSLLLKGFIPNAAGPWEALFVYVEKGKVQGWKPHPTRFRIYPHSLNEVKERAAKAGLVMKSVFGGFENESVDRPSSADLVYEFEKVADVCAHR